MFTYFRFFLIFSTFLVAIFPNFYALGRSLPTSSSLLTKDHLNEQRSLSSKQEKALKKKRTKSLAIQQKQQRRKLAAQKKQQQRTLIKERKLKKRTLATQKKKNQKNKNSSIIRKKPTEVKVKKRQIVPAIQKKLTEAKAKPIGYFSLLNTHNKKNANIGGLSPFFSRNILGKGQTVAVIDYAGGWAPLRHPTNTALPKAIQEVHKNNYLLPIGKGPQNDHNATNAWIGQAGECVKWHGALVSSYFLDFAPQAKVLPVSTYYCPQSDQGYSIVDALFELSLRKDVKIINTGGWDCNNWETQVDGYNADGTPTYIYRQTYTKRLIEAFKAATKAGKAIVIPAYNEGIEFLTTTPFRKNPEWRANDFFNYLLDNLDAKTKRSIIIAGNLDPDTRIAVKSSNRPGKRVDAQERFLFAPAGKIQVSYSGEITDGGTSSAAPYICATLANLLSKSKNITPQKAVAALLESAEKRPNVATYGRGVIRADRALDMLEGFKKRR